MTDDTVQLLNQREKTHGQYGTLSFLSQSFKEVARGAENWEKLNDGHKEAVDMICHKLARILNGDANYEDHWEDGSGYFILGLRSCKNSMNTLEKNIALSLSNVTAIVTSSKPNAT